MQTKHKKPSWLNKRVNLKDCRKLKQLLRGLNLNTVCEDSLCPNISECFSSGVATFMILGDICTRDCKFCGIKKGKPKLPETDEPDRVKEAVKQLNLNYVVITSPTRDDLADGGASLFRKTIEAIKSIDSKIRVEALIPDFSGKLSALAEVIESSVDTISHNLETVPSLYIKVRKKADYQRSLSLMSQIKKMKKNIYTKSGLMLGLGEKESEIIKVFKDLRDANCDFLTLGQYLPPSLKHYPLKKYVSPDVFTYFKDQAFKLGFRGVKSSAYTRSSYLAHTLLD